MFLRVFSFRAACLCIAISLGSCVDIPGGPPESAFDMRSQIRFVHVGAGIDTIALHLVTHLDTLHDVVVSQSTDVSGSDTIVVTDSAKVTTYPTQYYSRFRVDFSEPLDVVEDGSTIGHLNFGDATSYLNTSAGPRDISLLGSAKLLDTLAVQIADTHHFVRRDTVGKGSSHSDTLIASRSYSVTLADSNLAPERITVDYKNPKLVFITDRKASVFFIHDLQPIIAQEGNRVRYGWINYQVADERYSDRVLRGTPSVSTDSVGIRFLNASRNAPVGRLTIRGTFGNSGVVTAIDDSVALLNLTRYNVYHEGLFTLYLSAGGSPVPIDSLPGLTLTSHHRYSFVAVDSASTSRLRRYNDD